MGWAEKYKKAFVVSSFVKPLCVWVLFILVLSCEKDLVNFIHPPNFMMCYCLFQQSCWQDCCILNTILETETAICFNRLV